MRFAVVLLLTCAALWGEKNEHPAVLVGIYEGRLQARNFTLNLERDGKASMKSDASTVAGSWTGSPKELHLQLEGKPPLEWHVKGDRLIPKNWDKNEYGKKGLALRRPH